MEDSDTPRFSLKIHSVNRKHQVRFEIDDSDQAVFWRIPGIDKKNAPLGIQMRFPALPFFLEPFQKLRASSIITPKPVANPYDCCPA